MTPSALTRILCVACGALALQACNFTPLPSNNPDSGITCINGTSPAGSGTTQGAQAFAVGSSYQRAGQYRDTDSGVVAVGAQLDVQLLKKSVACTARPDAGDGDGFFATVINYNSDRVTAGTYPVSGKNDGGPAFLGLGVFDGGLRIANDGTFTLATVDDCAVSGSFDVRFGLPDGGGEPFSGTFSSQYCGLR
jgi:hypothetical protein